MEVKDLELEYKMLKDSCNNFDSVLCSVIIDITNFLTEYYNNENFNEIFADNLILHLAYLEKISEIIYDIEYDINCLELNNFELFYPETKKTAEISYIDDYIEIPENYNQDTYADINNPPDFSKLWKKRHLRLVDDNKDN